MTAKGAIGGFRSTLALAAIAMAATCESPGPAGPVPEPHLGYDPGHALVRLTPGVPIAAIHSRYGTRTIEAVESQRIYLLDLPSGRTVAEILPALRADPDLQAASPNAETSVPESQGRSTMAFADPSLQEADYDDQEAVHRVRAPAAWEVSRGGGAVVAVLDTGVDASHPGIAGSILGGGSDFVDGDADPSEVRDGFDSDEDGLVDEAFGHGTFIAGIVLSIAPDARILPVRVLDSDGIGNALDVARGIDFAVGRGARIVNMSFGMAVQSEVVADMIEEMSDQRRIVFLASAGNADSSTRQYPAGGVEVLAVAAVDPADRKADFSNYGAWIPLAAPGVGLVGPMPPEGYGRWSGTSFATAMASGEAAILVALEPGAGSDEVRATIASTAVAVGDSRLNGTRRMDVGAAVESLRGPASGDPGDDPGGDPEDDPSGDPGDDPSGDPGNDPGGDDPVLVVTTEVVVSVDLVAREILLATDVRFRIPTDDVIADGDFLTLAAVAIGLAAGDTVEVTATVVEELGGWRAVEVTFRQVGSGGVTDPEDPSLVVGTVYSIEDRTVVLVDGRRILLESDAAIDPVSSFLSLEALEVAIATGAVVEAEATVIDDGGTLRALAIEFRLSTDPS